MTNEPEADESWKRLYQPVHFEAGPYLPCPGSVRCGIVTRWAEEPEPEPDDDLYPRTA